MVDFDKARSMRRLPHVMVDLETLGTEPGCMVLSIGAVKFDPKGDPKKQETVGDPFYQNIKLDEQFANGMVISQGTLEWWFKQADVAKSKLFHNAVPLGEAMREFKKYYGFSEGLWSHGMNFDIPIIDHCFKLVGLDRPWGWNKGRDTRTLFDLANVWPERGGVHHYALDDAVGQARAVQKAYWDLRNANG